MKRRLNTQPRPKAEEDIRYTMLSEEDLLDFSLKTESEKTDTMIDEIYECQMARVMA